MTELAGHYTQEFSEAVIRGAQKEFDLYLKQATEVMVAEQDEEQEENSCQKTRNIHMVMVQIKCMRRRPCP